MTTVLVHLSDIHIKGASDPILKQGEKIAATVFSSLPDASHVFIIVSGDIAFSGTQEQYDLATNLLTAIAVRIAEEKDIPIDFIVCPGNHDCDFQDVSSVRDTIIKSIDQYTIDEIDKDKIDVCTSVQNEFFSFQSNLEISREVNKDKLWRSTSFSIGPKKIIFHSLNIAWMSQRSEKQASIYFPISRYEQENSDNADLVIVLMHHPFNWLEQSTYRNFRRLIRTKADIIINGHEHIGNVGTINDTESKVSSFIEASALQGDDGLNNSSFNIINIDFDNEQFSSVKYSWNEFLYHPLEEGTWSKWHDLSMSKYHPFTLTKQFQRKLDDPGACFIHPNTENLTLSDIFVFPDLKRVDEIKGNQPETIQSNQLLNTKYRSEHILLEGDEKSGRTSLMFQLYRKYHDEGVTPLYLSIKEFKDGDKQHIEKIILKAVEVQYGADNLEQFKQLPVSQKILFLDDFDDGHIKHSQARAQILNLMEERFSRLIISVSEMFEMKDLLEVSNTELVPDLKHYKLKSFGFQRRAELIDKWLRLGGISNISEADFVGQCDQAERLMDSVMTKLIIPSVPLYLITLLQSMDAGRSGEFQNSSLGEYYRFLLSQAFQQSGIKQDKLGESISYSAHLAWEFHLKNKSELTLTELQDFNDRFTKKWYRVDFDKKLKNLTQARVLIRVGESYAFHYPYIYYYLKGMSLSENLNDSEIRNYVKHCCEHLYVRDHANTILFLAHHTNDSFVVESIAQSYQKLFENNEPVKFNSDTKKINDLIQGAPNLLHLDDETPEQHRKNKNKLQDDLSPESDGLIDAEEESEDLSLIAKMTMLFKTSEILGQVLKNQYSAMERTRKNELIKELFNGPLRALSNFYDFIGSDPDSLLVEIEKEINRHNKTPDPAQSKKIAQKVVTHIIQFISFTFIMKAARSASSESLIENVHDAVQENNTVAFKLIELSIHLDSPKPMPQGLISSILADIKHDLISTRLIQMMVMSRLYMFQTSEKDMQWLRDSDLQLDLSKQHYITYQKQKERMKK